MFSYPEGGECDECIRPPRHSLGKEVNSWHSRESARLLRRWPPGCGRGASYERRVAAQTATPSSRSTALSPDTGTAAAYRRTRRLLLPSARREALYPGSSTLSSAGMRASV